MTRQILPVCFPLIVRLLKHERVRGEGKEHRVSGYQAQQIEDEDVDEDGSEDTDKDDVGVKVE